MRTVAECEEAAGPIHLVIRPKEKDLGEFTVRRVLPALQQLRERGELRPRKLFDVVETVRVPVSELAAVDPKLDTLANLNTVI